jgi:adenine-specific DNA glycosylase
MSRDPFRLAHGIDPSSEYEWADLRAKVVREVIDGLSPLLLAQEMVGSTGSHEAAQFEHRWRVTLASMFHVRTRREQGHPTLWRFLYRWPSVVQVADASVQEIQGVVRPLGLQVRRGRLIKTAARQHIMGVRPWPADPDVPMAGVGQYVMDAYRIFALKENISTDDRELRAFVAWRLRNRSG